MSLVTERLLALADKRPGLTVLELPGLDVDGFFVNKDGDCWIFVRRDRREYKKTAVLAHELGHYLRRNKEYDAEGVAREPKHLREALADRCSRRLLMFVRLGLWG